MGKYLFLYLKTGGGHLAPAKAVAEKIKAKRKGDAEIVIVCGNNKKLFNHVSELKDKNNIRNLRIYGFVDFIHSLINISDVVITKCGASTFIEILLMGKIPVINNYIWEQEKGNVEFVCKREMGILEKNINHIPDVLHRLFTDIEYFNSIRDNIKRASISNGVGQVSEYILKF